MIAARTFGPDQIVALLARLNRGEAVAFLDDVGGPLAFTVVKSRSAFVLRTSAGIALASASTFVATWCNRPRRGAALLAETGR